MAERNRTVHRMLVAGVTVEYRRKDDSIGGAQVRVIDFDTPANNDWLAVNQFTVAEGQHTRRLDVLLFVNGLPLAVIELKNAADDNATVWSAFQQLQTYQAQIPALFASNAALVISDGVQARIADTAGRREARLADDGANSLGLIRDPELASPTSDTFFAWLRRYATTSFMAGNTRWHL